MIIDIMFKDGTCWKCDTTRMIAEKINLSFLMVEKDKVFLSYFQAEDLHIDEAPINLCSHHSDCTISSIGAAL